MIGVINAYRFFLSPLIGQHCRFYPSCSAYARSAITTHGPFKGAWLAIRRLLRCHPWCAGGHDPVPGLTTSCAHAHRAAPSPTDATT